MSNSVRTIASDLTYDDRQRLLAAFQPVHPNVYAHHVTAAYRDVNVRVHGLKQAVVTGQVITDRVQVLLLQVDGEQYRPDGKLWHLTLSIADGAEPKEGGYVTLEQATDIDVHYSFQCLFKLRNARHDMPEIYLPTETLYAH